MTTEPRFDLISMGAPRSICIPTTGDAFASGFIYGYLQGWDWQRTARFANACGAIVVTRHACANHTPRLAEVEAFIADYDGAT